MPFEKLFHSLTPIGPFHTTVPAACRAAAKALVVLGPMSMIRQPAGMVSTITTLLLASCEKASAITTSDGNNRSTPARRAVSTISRAIGILSSSTRDLPTSTPSASRNVAAIPPPTMRVSALLTRFRSAAILSEALAPPSTAISGRPGSSKTRPSISSSRSIRNPDTEGRKWVIPSVDPWALCAAPKASFTNRSAINASS